MIKLIKVDKDSRILYVDDDFLGIENDNNVDILRFQFDDLIYGEARLLTNIKKDDENVFFSLNLNEKEKSYDLVVTKELLLNEYLEIQLQIVSENEVIWHSLQTELHVDDCLDVGTEKMPDSVSNWLINADLKLVDIDKSEKERISNEEIRIKNEESRKKDESIRLDNENKRKESENTRISNEENRISSENIRKTNEEARTTEENKRKESETSRGNNEKSREANESTRITNENNRIEAERNREEYIENFKKDVENEVFKGEKGDCNFAVFDIEEGELVMYKTEDMLLDFRLNDEGELEVLI